MQCALTFPIVVGLHAEGSIMSNLFGLFFWDVIFMDVPDVFHSAYQTHPLDLYSTLFYSNRQSAIDLRLEEIKTATVEVCFSSHIFGPKFLTINFKLTKILTRLLSSVGRKICDSSMKALIFVNVLQLDVI